MSVGGTSNPQYFGGLEIDHKSNLAGNWIGSSPGFSPRRTRSTSPPQPAKGKPEWVADGPKRLDSEQPFPSGKNPLVEKNVDLLDMSGTPTAATCASRPAMSGKYVIADSALIRLAVSGGTIKQEPTDQSFFDLAASLANRSAFSRSKFLRSAICSFSYSVSGLSDGRNMLLASFSRSLMT